MNSLEGCSRLRIPPHPQRDAEPGHRQATECHEQRHERLRRAKEDPVVLQELATTHAALAQYGTPAPFEVNT